LGDRQHEDAVHQRRRRHLADGFFVFLLGQLVQTPVLVHAVAKVLVDGSQLDFF
jgi:predicted ester cyclase